MDQKDCACRRNEFRIYTYDQAAEILGVGPEWLRRQVADGAVAHVRLGRNVRFTEDHLRALVDASSVGVRPAAPRPSSARSKL